MLSRMRVERFPEQVAGLQTKRIGSAILLFLLAAGAAIFPTRADDNNLRWKSVDGAQVKLDDKIPITWNVYQLDKKKQTNLALILLGHRYILLDSKAKLAYLVFPDQIHGQGDDVSSDDLALSSHLIPSVAWTVRDIGPAEEIKMTLNDYGRTLSLQLPHPIDIRLGVY
jgi:hypothetical protein